MSSTPRTDAILDAMAGMSDEAQFGGLVNFAMQLERELNEQIFLRKCEKLSAELVK